MADPEVVWIRHYPADSTRRWIIPATLLALLIAGAFAAWYFWLHPYTVPELVSGYRESFNGKVVTVRGVVKGIVVSGIVTHPTAVTLFDGDPNSVYEVACTWVSRDEAKDLTPGNRVTVTGPVQFLVQCTPEDDPVASGEIFLSPEAESLLQKAKVQDGLFANRRVGRPPVATVVIRATTIRR